MEFGKDFIYGFAKRTLDNILLLEEEFKKEEIKNQKKDYDVTQWLNSFIGLLVIPKEDVGNMHPTLTSFVYQDANVIFTSLCSKIAQSASFSKSTTISDFPQTIGCVSNYSYKHYNQAPNLQISDLLRHLRNSISHGHIYPISKKKNNQNIVDSLIFWDYDNRKNPTPYFCIELKVDEIKILLPAICHHLLSSLGYKDLSFIDSFKTKLASLNRKEIQAS